MQRGDYTYIHCTSVCRVTRSRQMPRQRNDRREHLIRRRGKLKYCTYRQDISTRSTFAPGLPTKTKSGNARSVEIFGTEHGCIRPLHPPSHREISPSSPSLPSSMELFSHSHSNGSSAPQDGQTDGKTFKRARAEGAAAAVLTRSRSVGRLLNGTVQLLRTGRGRKRRRSRRRRKEGRRVIMSAVPREGRKTPPSYLAEEETGEEGAERERGG